MNEIVLLSFPPGAECLKTLNTSCSVSFFFPFLFLALVSYHELYYRNDKKIEKWRTDSTHTCARRVLNTLISIGLIRAVTVLISGYSSTTVASQSFVYAKQMCKVS